jgi:monooxygenase
MEHVDVLIIGAGLSGICAAYRLQTQCPGKTYAILEARDSIGGTWDLFRYPGVRSDSDMATLGFPFEPWVGERSLVDGTSILQYIRDTASKYGIDRHIRFGHRVLGADWSSSAGRWTVEVDAGRCVSCTVLFLCAGYYDYAQGFDPDFPGREQFGGHIVHPQFWPEGLEYAGKRVVVIGSGATAVTLVPALLPQAAHVTMLQRSPTYIVSLPSRDHLASLLRRWLPVATVANLVRWKNILVANALFYYARKFPERLKKYIARHLQGYLPSDEIERNFTPRYNPWDQRLCFVPDGDLFAAIRSGRACVVTDEVEGFTPGGIRLRSGTELPADVVVTATGLKLQLFGGAVLRLDGVAVDTTEHVVYKGMMLHDVPNAVMALGYTNMSWTLRCDLIAQYVCRLLNHMDRHGYSVCVPRLPGAGLERRSLLDFSSGYIQRAAGVLPRQGTQRPWKLTQNYLEDYAQLRYASVSDRAMEFR